MPHQAKKSILGLNFLFLVLVLFGFFALFSPLNLKALEGDVTNGDDGSEENQNILSPGSNLNLNNVSVRMLISAISEITGKNFIIDPVISGNVSFVSGKEIPESELYNTFLLILQAYNYEAVEVGGNLYRIMPRVNAKKTNTKVVDFADVNSSPEIATTIITLNYIKAAKAFEILRPLIPDESHLAIYEPSNQLIISASEQSINQIRNLLEDIDVNIEMEQTEIIELKNSSALEIINILNSLTKPEDVDKAFISADSRTNNLLIKGKDERRKEVIDIIQKLDSPLENNNTIEIVALNYLDAKETATVLNELMRKTSQGENPTLTNDVSIQASEATNSLIVKGNNVEIKTIKDLVAKIDTKKPQVLVEAIIADVSDDFASELGVQWGGLKDGNYLGSVNFSASSNSIKSIGGNLLRGRQDLIVDSLGSGAVIGAALGNWSLLLNALENNSKANVLSRPSIVTLDNQEAEIFVGENVPFIQSSSGGDTPTTTVERTEVGIKLKVKPKINPDKKVTMNIEQEISALSPTAQNSTAVDLITQSRKINTKVSMDDREIIVLGGLSSDQNQIVEQQIPLLSSIPVLGKLFSYETKGFNKRSLMIFIRVVILPENSLQEINTLYQRNIKLPDLDEPPMYKEKIDEIYPSTEDSEIKDSTTTAFDKKIVLPEPFKEEK